MTCREGCRTKDHGSYADCLAGARITVNAMVGSPLQHMYSQTKRELAAYVAARRDGIQPAGTTEAKVSAAVDATARLGRPYDASNDPHTSLLRDSKNVLSAVKEGALREHD